MTAFSGYVDLDQRESQGTLFLGEKNCQHHVSIQVGITINDKRLIHMKYTKNIYFKCPFTKREKLQGKTCLYRSLPFRSKDTPAYMIKDPDLQHHSIPHSIVPAVVLVRNLEVSQTSFFLISCNQSNFKPS